MSIKRYIITTGEEYEILINTNYILKIEPCNFNEKGARTRIVLDSLSPTEPSLIYTNDAISTIKGKLTRARNKRQENE